MANCQVDPDWDHFLSHCNYSYHHCDLPCYLHHCDQALLAVLEPRPIRYLGSIWN